MIVIGEEDLITSTRLMGVSQTYEVHNEKQLQKVLESLKENHDIRIISSSVARMQPQLLSDPYTVMIPSPGVEMSSLNDLKKMMVDSLGISIPENQS